MISQEVVADECRVVQGEVQAWEAGVRIPTDAELDALARVLDLDRQALAEAETGSAVHRNELNAEQQAELDALFWGSDIKVPDLAERFGLQGRSLHKLVTPVRAGVACEDCGTEMIFTARDRRRVRLPPARPVGERVISTVIRDGRPCRIRMTRVRTSRVPIWRRPPHVRHSR